MSCWSIRALFDLPFAMLNPDETMNYAVWDGRIKMMRLCKKWGATDFNGAIWRAAWDGHIETVKLCKEWGATNFNEAMWSAAYKGHIEIVELCKEWGATNFDEAVRRAALEDHVEIVKLFRDWVGFEAIHQELFRHHHKRKCFRWIHDGVLPIAWHPDRFWNWCVDEEEKGVLKRMWES